MKGQQEVTILDIEDEEKDLITPPKKKLKQARLPFQVITPTLLGSDPKGTLPVANIKKRRLSSDSDDLQVVKIVKNDYTDSPVESKENLCVDNEKNEKLKKKDEKEIESVVENSQQKVVVNESEEELIISLDDSSSQSLKTVTTSVQDNPSNKITLSSPDVEESSIIEPKSELLDDSLADVVEVDASKDVSVNNCEVDNTEDFKIPTETISENNTSNADTTEKANKDETLSSSPQITTPKQKPLSQTGSETTPKNRKLTPGQQQKKEEREKQKEKLKEEKERQKREKEDQRKKEKEERERKKQAEIDMKNEEKRVKDEEKRVRDEEKRVKDEEKRVKDEEKRKKEIAEEEVKTKRAMKFTSFFVAKKSESKQPEEIVLKTVENQNFKPFQIKIDMRLAPLVRTKIDNRKLMEREIEKQKSSTLYLSEIKGRTLKSSGKTWPLSEFKDDVIILEADKIAELSDDNMILEPEISNSQVLRAKLLQFHENRRPPYWGTWRKKSVNIRPTFPYGKDDKLFDYEVDSDDEWEEEEPGESLRGSDDEKESVDDYEIDNDFFVPHGYLSDEENDGQEEEVMSPETQKAKLKLLELEFEEEMKHKTERIKPRLLGCIWANNHQDIAGTQLMKLLKSRQAAYGDDPIKMPACGETCVPSSPGTLDGTVGQSPLTTGTVGRKRVKLPDESVPSLIKLIHGNWNSRAFLCKEFAAFLKASNGAPSKESSENEISVPMSDSPVEVVAQRSISHKIKAIANWMPCLDEGPLSGRMCWYVSEEVRTQYGLSDLTVPNTWNYILKPRRNTEVLDGNVPTLSPVSTPKLVPLITNFTKTVTPEERKKQMLQTANSKLTPVAPTEIATKKSLITKFTKVMSTEERQQQLKQVGSGVGNSVTVQDKVPGISKSQTAVPRKRAAILVSVPRGQDIPKPSGNLMDRYITTDKDQQAEKASAMSSGVQSDKDELSFEDMEDECILLSD